MVSSRVRTQELNLPELEGSMDAACLARRLRLACFSQSHKTVWQRDGTGDGLLPFLLDYLEKNAQFVDYPAIGVYFFGLRALAPTGSGDDFEQFKRAIFAHAAAFPEDEGDRSVRGFTVVARDLPRGCLAAYYPEANPLLALSERDLKSGTPAYKAMPVRLGRAR